MIRLNKVVLSLIGALSIHSAIAAVIDPSVIAFNQGQRISLNLSNVDINRLSVPGDQITDIKCPGTAVCTVNYDKTDSSGAAYVSLAATDPFTMYIITAQDRSFSLLVTPQAVPGETYVFQPMGSGVNASGWEKDTDYEDINISVIGQMINGQSPDGFGYQQCSKDSPCANMSAQKVYGVIQMTPVAEYDGDDVIGLVYQLTNTGKEDFTAPPSAFYHTGVRSISLQSQTLKGGESANLYEVITNPNSDVGE